MALTRGVAATIQVLCEGAAPPIAGSIIGGAALSADPSRVGETDWYDVALTAEEMDAESFGLSLIDAVGAEFGFTVVPDDLTPERLAKLDGAAQEATVEEVAGALAALDGKVDALNDFDPATQSVNVGAVGGTEVTGPDDLKADVSGVLEAIDAIDFPPPDDGVAITQATLGTDGDPLGRVMPYGRITAYLGTVPHYQFDADADGDYAYTLPAGSAWTLVARRAGYRTMTTEVTT